MRKSTEWMASNPSPAHSCNCVGPQDGQPLCPCQMRSLIIRDGKWIRPEQVVAPVRPFRQPETDVEKIARLKAEIADLEAGITP